MIPSVNSSGFKAILDLLELRRMGAKLRWRRVIGLGKQSPYLIPVRAVRLRER
jgi:hypothetical protein